MRQRPCCRSQVLACLGKGIEGQQALQHRRLHGKDKSQDHTGQHRPAAAGCTLALVVSYCNQLPASGLVLHELLLQAWF